MIKKFDCVKMKIQLQEKLYDELNPKDFNDYFEKIKEKTKHNKLYMELKNKLRNENNKKYRSTTTTSFNG